MLLSVVAGVPRESSETSERVSSVVVAFAGPTCCLGLGPLLWRGASYLHSELYRRQFPQRGVCESHLIFLVRHESQALGVILRFIAPRDQNLLYWPRVGGSRGRRSRWRGALVIGDPGYLSLRETLPVSLRVSPCVSCVVAESRKSVELFYGCGFRVVAAFMLVLQVP